VNRTIEPSWNGRSSDMDVRGRPEFAQYAQEIRGMLRNDHG
jgi:hypothetical protein